MSDLPASQNPKKRLRQEARHRREQLPMLEISQAIRQRLAAWPVFQSARRVLLYVPFRQEVDLLPLVEAYPKKRWYLPQVCENSLVFREYRAGQVLEPGAYDIPAPGLEAPELDSLRSEDLIFVPGLMFDTQGQRLGYGKGFYDRFLTGLHEGGQHPVRVGAVPEALIAGNLPVNDWDIPVDWLASERAIISCHAGAKSP